MASKIRVLAEDTINKIAAGEVIENPASVVKELVENSLDAGSTEITVEVKIGGRHLIRVTDNGFGMNSDDALLCLERHATSKLKEIDDIHSLDTMGFRGEAIPSIASISKFTLFTRPNEQEGKDQMGTMVIVDGGKIQKCCAVECALGTTIEVKSLFFNVPVRRKFQKSPGYDSAEVHRIMMLLGLGNPSIQFQLINNQSILLSAPVYDEKESFEKQLKERIIHILGKEYANGLCHVRGTNGEYSIEGYISLPAFTKQNRSGQYLFINRRGIVSSAVNFAVRDGYGTMLGERRHPLFVLHIDMPGGLVDVNVHPQKREVRLRQERTLKDLIIRSVGEALQKSGFSESFAPVSLPPLPTSFQEPIFSSFQAPTSSCFQASSPQEPLHEAFHRFNFNSLQNDSFVPAPIPTPQFVENSNSGYLPEKIGKLPLIEKELFEIPPAPKQGLKVLGTIPRYILIVPSSIEAANKESVLCLVDQRAAHARIVYERLLGDSTQNVELQTLLIPYTFDLSPAEAGFLKSQLTVLQATGIHIKEFGQNTFVIDALPQVFGNVDIHKLSQEILKSLHDFSDGGIIEKERKRKIALAASRVAISSERRLQLEEAQSLINQLMECQYPYQCPNGKSTLLLLTHQEIDKLFQHTTT